MEEEIWKPIPIEELKDRFEVSSFGRIRNARTKYVRKLHTSNTGYYWVTLSYYDENGNRHLKWLHVHRITAMAFIPNPQNLPCVNHKDENRLNNNVDNLEWCDVQYNNNYGTRTERAVNTWKNKKKAKVVPVAKVDEDGNIVKEYDSIRQASKDPDNPSYTSIYKAINHIDGRLTAGGYRWVKTICA